MVKSWQWFLIVHVNLFPQQVLFLQPYWKKCKDDFKFNIINSIWGSRKSSTVEKYCLAIRRFLKFCSERNVSMILPIDSLLAAEYLTFLQETNGTKGAVSSAISSLKWLHSFVPGLNDLNNPLNEEFLSRISQSTNRNNTKIKIRKKPLTENIISGILNKLPKDASVLKIRNALIPIMAYSLLLRHDELSHLNCNHFTVLEKGLRILIPSSKTDTFREGKFVFLSGDNKSLYDLFFLYLKKSDLCLGQNHFLFCPIRFEPKSKKLFLTL